MEVFDLENWNRKTQFEFFKNYEDPFFNITANLDVTQLYDYCKKNDYSFSLTCLYLALKGVNEIAEFRLRFVNNKVMIFDTIHIGSTILNHDKTFSFCYFEYKTDLKEFLKDANKVLQNHGENSRFEPKEGSVNLVHCTTIPWVSFTGFKHAKKGDEGKTGIPKLVFGKMIESNNTRQLPFSVEVHHALMDGLHVGDLFFRIQNQINILS